MFTKYGEKVQKFRKAVDLKQIYKNDLDKACFAQDESYFDSKDIASRTVSDKVLKYRAYKVAINLKYGGYQRGLTSMVIKFFDKKMGSWTIVTSKAGASVNEELVRELNKPVIKKFKRRKVCARF